MKKVRFSEAAVTRKKRAADLLSALYTRMAKLVDAPASKAGVERRVGSSPTLSTNRKCLL